MFKKAKCASTLLLSLAGLLLAPIIPANAWEFSLAEEDWGPTCFLTEPHNAGGDITILSSEGEFNPAMLISMPRYPRGNQPIPVTFIYPNDARLSLEAVVDDYFGNLYISLNKTQFDRLTANTNLYVVAGDNTEFSMSINREDRAIQDFVRCMQGRNGGGQQATNDGSTAPTVNLPSTGEWTALSNIGPGWEPGPNPIDEIQYRISAKGHVELRGRLYLSNAELANTSGGSNIYRVLLRLPDLQGKQYTFNHYTNVRTEREGAEYGQAHRMELEVYDQQLVYPYTEVQNPSTGTPTNVTLFGVTVPIE